VVSVKIKDIEDVNRPREIFRRQSLLNAARRFGEMPMFKTTMLKKITHALMALTMAFGLSMSAPQQAQAGHGRGVGIGIAAGIIGLGLLSAGAHAHGYNHSYSSAYDDDRECYRGARECHWSGRRCFENRWGDTVCRGGRYLCERPVICE
jgi:hypothetical protein